MSFRLLAIHYLSLLWMAFSSLSFSNEFLKYRIAEKEDNFIVIAVSKKEDTTLFSRKFYRVKGGETLEDISENYRIPVEEIIRINDLRNRRDLQPEQILFLEKNPAGVEEIGETKDMIKK